MTFDEARRVVAAHLSQALRDQDQHPQVLAYGWDTGTAWGPMVDWDGLFGSYLFLVDKRGGALTPVSLPEFLEMPAPLRVGAWPDDLE